MTDRELLELAAKAAGINVLVAPSNAAKLDGLYCWINKTRKPWNPLADDGDALRLAVKLNAFNTRAKGYEWPDYDLFIRDGDDPFAATRRAIVQVAASLGAQA